uniref:Ribosomal protein S17 n=1 Tax=Meloidogyne incognita TaxID=6306 RepID=A0A914M2Z5_MELIC
MLIPKSRRPPVIIRDGRQIKPNPLPWELKISRELLLGKVKVLSRIGLEKIPCLHVRVPLYTFFEVTRIFYRTFELYWALDPEEKCKLGDVVIIRKLPEEKRIASTVPYLIEKVVFEHGARVDLLSKKRNFEGIYEDEMNIRKQLVEEVYNEPLAEKTLSYDKKRSLIKQRIRQRLNLLKNDEN